MMERTKKTGKEKSWYDLLEQYNHFIEEKMYNKNILEEADYWQVRRKILNYLHKTYNKAEGDLQGYYRVLLDREQNIMIADYKYSNSRPMKWMKKADNIFASLQRHQLIDKADIENSYYGLRFFNGCSTRLVMIAERSTATSAARPRQQSNGFRLQKAWKWTASLERTLGKPCLNKKTVV